MGRRTVGADPLVARGQIWWVRIEGLEENKRFLIVSNNARNRKLRDVLGVRITTREKPVLPSIAVFEPGEISESRCYAVADDIVPIDKELLVQVIGSATPRQMRSVEDALRAALDL